MHLDTAMERERFRPDQKIQKFFIFGRGTKLKGGLRRSRDI
jgi:hypothetical protein